MDHPQVWARGKTWDEVLNTGGQMFGALTQLAIQPSAPAAPTPQVGNDDVVDGKTFNQAVSQFAPIASQVQAMARQNAVMAFDRVKGEPEFKPIFPKYEHEVVQNLVGIPAESLTLDMIRTAARMVMGSHHREIAQDVAREMAAQGGYSVRTDGFAATSPNNPSLTLESEKLPDAYKDLLKRQGIGIRQVEEFCRVTGQTVDQWFKEAMKMGNAVMGDR